MLRGTLVVAIALGASVAHAETEPTRWYPTASVGPGVGCWFGDVGGLTPAGLTIELDAQVTLTRMFHVRVMYEHAFLDALDDKLKTETDLDIDGIAVLLQHPLFAFPAMDIRIGGDMHVLAGVERERLVWDSGAVMHRTEVVVGFGGTIVVYDHDRKHPEHQIDYGLRVQFARAPSAAMLPATSYSTGPFDHSMIMEVAWHWGR